MTYNDIYIYIIEIIRGVWLQDTDVWDNKKMVAIRSKMLSYLSYLS